MNLLYNYRFRLLFGLLFLSAIIVARIIIHSVIFYQHPIILSNALSADFIITLPFFAWLLLVRKKIINLPVFLTIVSVCYFTLTHLLPQQQNQLLQSVKYILAAGELISISWIIIKIRKISSFYQSLAASNFDFPEKLQLSLESVFGQNKIAGALASELLMVHYSLFFWYKHKHKQHLPNEFSIYKNTPFTAFISVFSFMLIVETSIVHLLLLHYQHEKIALGLLIAEVYSLLFIIAYLISVKQRLILIDDHEIKIRIGLLYTAQIKAENIKSIQLINASFTPKKTVLNLAKPVFDQPNILLQLQEPVAFSTAFGIRKYYQEIALHIDQKEDFLESVKILIAANR